jgi:hypothetical protein
VKSDEEGAVLGRICFSSGLDFVGSREIFNMGAEGWHHACSRPLGTTRTSR